MAATVTGAADHAGVGGFRVANDPRFVDVFAGQADVRKPDLFPIGKAAFPVGPNLAALLRRVVFVGEAALRHTFDFQRVGTERTRRAEQRKNLSAFALVTSARAEPARTIKVLSGQPLHALRTITLSFNKR